MLRLRFLGKLVGSEAARLRFLASPPEHMQSRPRSQGTPATFFVFYEIDDDESKASKNELSLNEYGHNDVVNAWVLLEVEATAA